MKKTSLNECFKIHALNLGLEDYHSLLVEKNEESKEAIDKLSYENLVKYADLVKTKFKSYNNQGEVQNKSLIEIFMDIAPKETVIQNMFKNVKYIIEIEASAATTIEKLNNKIETLKKTLQEDERQRVKSKLNNMSYEDLVFVFHSEESLRGFITN